MRNKNTLIQINELRGKVVCIVNICCSCWASWQPSQATCVGKQLRKSTKSTIFVFFMEFNSHPQQRKATKDTLLADEACSTWYARILETHFTFWFTPCIQKYVDAWSRLACVGMDAYDLSAAVSIFCRTAYSRILQRLRHWKGSSENTGHLHG